MSDTTEMSSQEEELDDWQFQLITDVSEFMAQNVVCEQKEEDNTIGMSKLPNEIIGEIGSFITDPVDFGNLRLVNRRFYAALNVSFAKNFCDGRVVYPRYDSFLDFFVFLASVDVACHYINRIVLVGEGMRVHEHGHDWAWEALLNLDNIDVTNNDMAIMYAANVDHAYEVTTASDPFLTTGGYRSLLSLLLAHLPKLRVIEVRKMMPGEHAPGWKGPEMLKQLSFYHPSLNTNEIYYGDWQYDTLHLRVTHHKDEFGDDVIEPGAGPQASCKDDVKAAVAATRHKARLVFLPSA